MRGQAVDLLGVKNRVAFHERNFGFNLRALLVGAGLGEGVGVNDQRTFFAFAHLSAKFGGLLVGQPQRAAIALLHGGRPKHQNIDATIGNASGAKRTRYSSRLVSSGLPRLQPCEIAALDVGDDFVGDSAVNVQFLGHCRFSLFGLVAAAAATLPIGEIGVCKPQEENSERGINSGRSPKGVPVYAAKVRIIVLDARRGAGP